MQKRLTQAFSLLTLLVGGWMCLGEVQAQPAPASPALPPVAAPPTSPTAAAASTPAVAPSVTAEGSGDEIWWTGSALPLDPAEELKALRELEAPAPRSAAELSNVYSYQVKFEEDLYMQSDLVLPGLSSVQTVSFSRPRQWALQEGTELRLVLEHSSSLIADRSHMIVSLNDVMLRSIRLENTNITNGEVRIPLPINLLKDYNRLRFQVQQSYTYDCEDPFDPALWSKISRSSSINMVYKYVPIKPELSTWPLPFFDRQGYGHTVFRLVLPQRPSSQTLQALGLVATGIGQEVNYGRAAVAQPLASLDEARGHAIVIGTVQENPEVQRLVGNRIGGLSANQGLLAIVPNPKNPTFSVLVVSGGGPDGVLSAASALSSRDRNFISSGDVVIIEENRPEPLAVRGERQGFIPPSTFFTLKDLGFQDVTVRGFFAGPIKLEMRTLPDARVYERLQSLKLYYSYGAQLDTRLSTLEVRWNNITIQSVALDNPDGETRAELNISIPHELISSFNAIEFVFHLLPRGYDPCATKFDHQIWGSIFADSELVMPRYNHTKMPSLNALQFGYYPYGAYQDLQDTLLVLPDAPDANDMIAATSVALELGRGNPGRRLLLRLIQANDVTPELRASRHMIVLQTGRQNSLLEALKDSRVLSAMVDGKVLRDDKGNLLQQRDINTLGILEQFISPYGPERLVTVLQGLNPQTLKQALRMMLDIRVLSQLKGDIAVMGPSRSVEARQIREQVSFGQVPLLVQARQLGRSYPWLIVAMLLAALFLLYLVLRVLLSLYRRRHHGGSDDPGPGQGPGGPAGAGSSGGGAVTSEKLGATTSASRARSGNDGRPAEGAGSARASAPVTSAVAPSSVAAPVAVAPVAAAPVAAAPVAAAPVAAVPVPSPVGSGGASGGTGAVSDGSAVVRRPVPGPGAAQIRRAEGRVAGEGESAARASEGDGQFPPVIYSDADGTVTRRVVPPSGGQDAMTRRRPRPTRSGEGG